MRRVLALTVIVVAAGGCGPRPAPPPAIGHRAGEVEPGADRADLIRHPLELATPPALVQAPVRRQVAPGPTQRLAAAPPPATEPSGSELKLLRQLADTSTGVERTGVLDRIADALDRRAAAAPADTTRLDDAIAAYKKVTLDAAFATYPGADRVLLRHGQLLVQAGRVTDARASLMVLVKNYPSSDRVPEAYLVFAEWAFEQAELATAKQFYDKVLMFPKATIAPYARYKRAWVAANLGEWQDALEGFYQVSRDGTGALRDAAGTDAVLAYANIGKAEKAFAFFSRFDAARAEELTRRLGETYLDLGKAAQAAVVFRAAAGRATDPVERCTDRVGALRAVILFADRAAITAEAGAVEAEVGTGGAGCATEADGLIGELAQAWAVEQTRTLADPGDAIAMTELAARVGTTPARRAAARHNHDVLVWRRAERTANDPAAWVVAGEALQAVDVVGAETGDLAIDAWDNAIRAARGRLDAALADRIRRGLELAAPGEADHARVQALRGRLTR